MADIKITELPQATSVSDSDELIIQQPSGTKRAGIADLPVGSPLSAGDGIDITNNVVSNTKPMNYEETGSVPSATPLNADQLQGHPASYFQQLLSAGSGIEINGNVISSHMEATTLWSNSSSASSFAAQTISLSENILNYDFAWIQFRSKTTSSAYTSIFVPTSALALINIGYSFFGGTLTSRGVSYSNSGNSLTFTDASNTAVDNTLVIPNRIIGYK